MNRSDLLFLINAALAHEQPAYAREAAQLWLSEWPGDLRVLRSLAQACLAEGDPERAAEHFEAVALADPENAAAQQALCECLLRLGREAEASLALVSAMVLNPGIHSSTIGKLRLPAWFPAVREGKDLLDSHEWEPARIELESALLADPPCPLPFLLHLRTFWGAELFRSATPLAEVYCQRWPRTVAFHLALAECLLRTGDDARAVEVLHTAASLDIAGEVAFRYWGEGHPYRDLWPHQDAASLPGPVPASLSAALGLNRLSQAVPGSVSASVEPSTKRTVAKKPNPQSARARTDGVGEAPVPPDNSASLDPQPGRVETLVEIEAELNRVAEQIASRKRGPSADERKPAYILITSRSRLEQRFGRGGYSLVESEMARAAARVRHVHHWPAYPLAVDDPATLTPFRLTALEPGNAWEIKKLLADLDAALAKRGQMIGALLIVGGDDILPMHRLPNPTDDVDDDVPSDNPYAARDENYFVPEWPVGRLPSAAGDDPELLIRLLRRVASGDSSLGKEHGPLERLLGWIGRRLVPARTAAPASFGYAAGIWKPASLEVFAPIGEPRRLVTSPPVDASRLPPQALAPSRFSYFNLHGLEDSPDWYGQRPAEEIADGLPEYPVAIRPVDVVNSGRAPEIVLTEACYGANIQRKAIDEAMCLKFLASGTAVVIGSTKIAYGSITTPLIGADLLTRLCSGYALRGLPLGEALRKAKLTLAQEMHRRQGYLDGEDQKTLISFVFYGDPLHTPKGVHSAGKHLSRTLHREKTRPTPLPTLDERPQDTAPQTEADETTVAAVKSIVAQYLPGMASAEIRVWQPPANSEAKSASARSLNRKMVSLAKTHHDSTRIHHTFARVTLDENGKVMKLAVSR